MTPTADSVRLALPSEAAALAAVQRRAWQQQGEVGAAALAALDLAEMAQQWTSAITRPPLARCRVLVALAGSGATTGSGGVVGFATTQPSTDADAREGHDGEVGTFVVDPAATGRGHGSRLLHACVDTLRADGFDRARWWLGATDDGLRAFLTAAGWAPDGAFRELGAEADAPDATPLEASAAGTGASTTAPTAPGAGGALRLRQVRLHTDISDATPEANAPTSSGPGEATGGGR